MASSAPSSDIRPKTGSCSHHIRESRVIYILNHSAQPSKDGINLKWPLIVKAAAPETLTCAVVIFFFCWLVSLMWLLIMELQGSYRRKQLIVPLPTQFFWAFKTAFITSQGSVFFLQFHFKSLKANCFVEGEALKCSEALVKHEALV